MSVLEVEPAVLSRPASSKSVEVFRDFAPALEAWAALEETSPAPIYATRRFAIPWHNTMGKAAGIKPMIVLIRGGDGEPLALFPFGARRSHGITRVEFLGGKDSNANMGLFAPGVTFNEGEIAALLIEAGRRSGLSPDCCILANQPETWEGFANPLHALLHQPSASQCHSAQLIHDSEEFVRTRLSGDTRKKMRSKRRKLEEMGQVTLLTARTSEEADRLLEAFFAQKLQRFDDKNIKSGFDSPQARDFFARCCVSRIGRRDATVELHGLLVDDRIVATYGGGVHRGRFHGMINSFELDSQIARCSPGDLLLGLLVEAKCRQGLAVFDLGTGEGRYKSTWCDREEPLFDSLIPLTALGRTFVRADAARRHVKRAIKQSAWAWPLVQKLRQKMRLGP